MKYSTLSLTLSINTSVEQCKKTLYVPLGDDTVRLLKELTYLHVNGVGSISEQVAHRTLNSRPVKDLLLSFIPNRVGVLTKDFLTPDSWFGSKSGLFVKESYPIDGDTVKVEYQFEKTNNILGATS